MSCAARCGMRRGNVLSRMHFRCLWLSYVEAMAAEEIGRVLGRSANAVRILLHRRSARLAVEAEIGLN